MSLFTDLKEILTPYASRIKNLDNQVSDVKADLGAQTGIIIMTKNGYIDTNGTPISLEPHYSSAGRMYAVIDCAPSDKFVINAYSNTSVARAWCFIDSANNAISMAEALADVTDLELTSPNNATKLIINDMRGGMSYKVGNNLATKADNCLSDDIKSALLACFEHVAWSGTGDRTYYNALKDALLPQNWDYEWSPDSGVLPEYMTANTYNFTTENGALYVVGGILNFEYTGNAVLEVEIKNANLQDNNPQLTLQNEIVSEGVYRGLTLILSSNLGTSSEHGMCAVGVNGENSLITRTNSNEYHTYRLTAINNVYSLSIDGENIPLTQNDNTTRYIARTGMYCASGISAFIKSIKFKRL